MQHIMELGDFSRRQEALDLRGSYPTCGVDSSIQVLLLLLASGYACLVKKVPGTILEVSCIGSEGLVSRELPKAPRSDPHHDWLIAPGLRMFARLWTSGGRPSFACEKMAAKTDGWF